MQLDMQQCAFYGELYMCIENSRKRNDFVL